MKTHYIYKITNKTTGEYYYGKRSCNGSWEKDKYMGSGTVLKKKMQAHPDHEWVKEVLLLLDSEKEAFEYEAVVIGDKWATDPSCLNQCPGLVNVDNIDDTYLTDEYRSWRGKRCHEIHGDYITNNLNEYARSDRGRRVSSETMRKYFSDDENMAHFKAMRKEVSMRNSYKEKVRKPIKMLYQGEIKEILREDLLPSIEAGYEFKSKYVHLHNPNLGIWTEGVVDWKAKKLLVSNAGWEYGKNRSLQRVSITKINLDNGELL